MILEQIQTYLTSMGDNAFHFISSHLIQVLTVGWFVIFIVKFLRPQLRFFKSDLEDVKGVLREVLTEIKEEAQAKQDPPEGVPFEEYRKDLWRMAEGTLSIEEFVDIWRGRKVQPRRKLVQYEPGSTEEALSILLKETFGQDLLRDWAQHLGGGNNPTSFSQVYLECLSNPLREDQRMFCSAFATYMKPRCWAEVLTLIEPAIRPEDLGQFRKEYAETFYNGFRDQVVAQIREYWEDFLSNTKAKYSGVSGVTGIGPRGFGATAMAYPAGLTAPSWNGQEGGSGIEGASGIPGNPGSSDLFQQMRELRASDSEKSSAGGAIFDLINIVTKTLGDAHIKSMKELADQEAIRRVGTWVRVRKPGSGMVGMIAQVQSVVKAPKGMEDWITIKCCLVKGASAFMWGFDADKLEPALPRVGERWRWTRERCPKPHGEDLCAFHSNTSDRERGFLFDALPEENRAEWFLEEVKQGCLEPVNYGFGK